MKLHERLFMILVACIPVQLGKHSWPSWAFVLGRRVDYLSPTLFGTDILLAFLIICWCIEEKGFISKIIQPNLRKMIFPGIALIVLSLGNVFLTGNHKETWLFWARIWELAVFIMYIQINHPPFSRIVSGLCVSALYSSLIAISQFSMQHSIGGLLKWIGERSFTIETPGIARTVLCLHEQNCRMILRSYATFPHPNVLGGFLSAVITIVVGFSLISTKYSTRPTRWLIRLSLIVSLVSLIVTFSRSAWLSVSIGMGLLILMYIFREKSHRFPPFLLIGIAIVYIAATVVMFPSVQDESVTMRRELAVQAHELWQKSPVIGIGGNRFLPSLPSITLNRHPGFLQPVHSIYLLLRTEIGISGLVLFIMLPSVIVLRILRMKRNLPHDYVWMKQIFFVALVQILFIGLVDHYPITLQQGQLLFALLLGIGLTPSSRV